MLSRAGKNFALSALLALLFSAPVFADNVTDISALMRSGQFAEALAKIDASLVQTPRDKQLRFMKGVILTEQNKPAEAIAVFTKLTEDFPELPEPYNNLAVLFAANGQYDKARASLEMAIRTNPTYSTAHENLGDVYAKLASQAYDKALQLDSGNTTAKTKLTMVKTLVGNPGNTPIANSKAPTSMAAVTPAVPVASKPAPVVVAAAPKMPAPVVVKQEAKPEAKPEPKPEAKIVVAKAEPKPKAESKADVKPEPKATAKAAASNAEQDEIAGVVNAWAKAWAAKDVPGYLNFYASDFQPANNQPRKAWTDDRRARIEGKGNINIKIESLKISVDGNTATAKFRQQYVSNQLRSNSPKTLVMEKQSGKWHIKQERTGS
ncbi:L,D-transpeptidase Cds6 family protein [Actimicrobium antarcticum]